jgi:triacylglycerol lipase
MLAMHRVVMSSHLVVVHGLGCTARSMAPVARAAQRRGYRVLNLGYASRTARVADLAEHVAHAIGEFAPEVPALDFVTHSLGGILIRAAVSAGILPLERVRRVVMLAPPNRGSEAADFVTRFPLIAHPIGPALAELGVGDASFPLRLPPVSFECGVIAGTRSVNPILSRSIPGADDGKVALSRASVGGVRDFLAVPHSHPFIMRPRMVHEQIFHFLEHGTFARSATPILVPGSHP